MISQIPAASDGDRARHWFVESLDRVNRAIQGTNNLEQMMTDVLDASLSIFDCDRAWLVYPCDPNARWQGVQMLRAKPEFPRLYPRDLPMEAEAAEVFRIVRAASGPVQFGPVSPQHPLSGALAERLGIRSRIAIALYPKGDEPYMFGLSQCAYPRVWTTLEQQLFEEIGRRLADALTSLSIVRSLRESENRYRHIFESTGVSIWEEDFSAVKAAIDELKAQGVNDVGEYCAAHPEFIERALTSVKIRDVNETTVALFEAVRKDDLLVSLHNVYEPETREHFVKTLITIAEGGSSVATETVHRTLKGRRLTVLVTITLPPPSAAFDSVLVTKTDITERKRSERRIAAQHAVTQILAGAANLEEATPKILHAVGEGLGWEVAILWRTDREARLLRCVEVWHSNAITIPDFEASCRRTTFPPGSGLPGRVWSSREPLCIPDIGGSVTYPRAPIGVREGLRAGFGFPIQLGGEVLGVMEFFSREIREAEQVLIDMMSVVNSQIGQFIERKRAEDALHHAHAELAHVGRVVTLGEMTASIAHDVNQPLAAIVADANACLNWLGAAEPDLDKVRDALSAVVSEGHRAGDVIQRIRQLARKTDPQQLPVDINDVVRDVLPLCRPEVRSHDVSLRLELAPDLPSVLGDRVQLQQVLINLVVNAIEAMDRIKDRPRELAIRSRLHQSDEVLVAVEDAGAGIDPGSLDQVFDAFFTTKPNGMGMGLSISRSIIDAHGGRLWATPNAAHGVTFHFALPVVR